MMKFYEIFHQREADSCAGLIGGHSTICLMKSIKNKRQFLFGNAASVVFERENDVLSHFDNIDSDFAVYIHEFKRIG